jgi:hypothetical protein
MFYVHVCHFNGMIFAVSEEAFNQWYQSMRQAFPSNIVLLQYIDVLAEKKASYAKFILEGYSGSKITISSNTCEQNHSS